MLFFETSVPEVLGSGGEGEGGREGEEEGETLWVEGVTAREKNISISFFFLSHTGKI